MSIESICVPSDSRLVETPRPPPLGPVALRRHIAQHGCYDEAENLRIYQKWFTGQRPRDKLFRYLRDKLHLSNGVLADVGCGYGATLVHCGAGSYGLELEDYNVDFARSIGLNVVRRNIVTDDLSDVPLADTVWCAATLEHVDAPHVFLRRLYYLLKPHGRLIVEVPCALPAPWMRVIPGMEHIYGDHDDHVNSFSPTSLARFCERAGFAQEWLFRYSTPLVNRQLPVWMTRLPPLSAVADSIVYVGTAVPSWDYPPKATRRAANNSAGYRFRSQFAPPDAADITVEQRH
jgi:SAM-dependent methyltransferase